VVVSSERLFTFVCQTYLLTTIELLRIGAVRAEIVRLEDYFLTPGTANIVHVTHRHRIRIVSN